MISHKALSFPRSLLLLIVIGMALGCSLVPAPTPNPAATPIRTPTVTPLPSPTPTPAPVSQSIDAGGGTITLANGTKLMVPAGAVEGSGEIAMEPLEMPEDEFIPSIAGPIYQITLQDAELVAPVQISIPLPEGITPEEFEIAVYHYDENRPAFADPHLGVDLPPLWMPLPSTVTDGYVSAWVDSFSLFGPGWFWKGEEASVGITVAHHYTGGNLKVSVNGSYCFEQSTFHIDPMVDTEATIYLMMDTSWGYGHLYHRAGLDKNLAYATDSYSLDFRGIAEGETPQRCQPVSHTFEVPLEDYIDEKTASVKLYVMFESEALWYERLLKKQFFSYLNAVYITNRASVKLVPPSGRPGDPIGIFGEGFKAGESVDLIWDLRSETGTVFATVAADEDGKFIERVNIPPNAPPHTVGEVIAEGQDSKRVASETLTILELIEPSPEEQRATLHTEGSTVIRSEVEGFSDEEIVWHIYDHAGETELKRRANDEYSVDLSEYLSPGQYSVVLEIEDPDSDVMTIISNRVVVTFGLPEDPLECLTLTPVGGDAARYVVLPRSIEEPVVVQFEVEDRCDRADPADWTVVNYLGDLAKLTLHEGSLLTVEPLPGARESGTYNGAVGIHYPGRAYPTLVGLEVTITDLSYVLPAQWSDTYTHWWQWGKNEKVEGEVSCIRTDKASADPSDRFITKYVEVVCSPEERNDSWATVYDRLSGRFQSSTCVDCWEPPGPRPDAPDAQPMTVAGQEVTAYPWVVNYTMDLDWVKSDTTDGYWQYECEETRWFDTITGHHVKAEWYCNRYFTGTYNGQRLEHKYYGHWTKGYDLLEETTFPMGEVAQESAELEPECEYQVVPDVLGKSLTEAADLLTSAGYGFTWKDEHLGEEDEGLIVLQNPEPGTCRDPRSTVVELTRNVGD